MITYRLQDNVLVSPKKQALLTDFGISQMTSLSTVYSSDTVKGSGRWQAIEFFSFREEDDPPPLHTIATDVWAFGMTIYVITSSMDAIYEDKLIRHDRSCCRMTCLMLISRTEIKSRSSYQEDFFQNIRPIVRKVSG